MSFTKVYCVTVTVMILFLTCLLGHLPGADVAKQLFEAIRAKKDVDQLQTILNNIPANATGHEDFNADGIYSLTFFCSFQCKG